jgi:hypothetical protein
MMASGPKGQALNDAPLFEPKIGSRGRPFKSIRDTSANILRLLRLQLHCPQQTGPSPERSTGIQRRTLSAIRAPATSFV